ncbi:MAG TPA: hypothetical protein VFQ35_20875 [Polyangiaceae bacterium]|nr:hypothetical protein [Polyangiaceae bacterium]
MSEELTRDAGFTHGQDFVIGEISGALGLGPLEMQYEGLFAEALEDGIITPEERARLERAADNLGLDRARLMRLEQAMLHAWQARHKVEIVEHYEDVPRSLSPLRVEAEGDAGRALLLKRIEQLETRVRELEAELRRAQAAVNVEVDLSAVESAAETASQDPEAVWRRLRRDPTNHDALHQLFDIYWARSDTDRAFCVAQALVLLEAASPDERAVFEQHRMQTLIAPRNSISQAAWHDLLFHPEEEVLTGQIFATIAPAVLVGRVTALRRDRKLHQPPAEARQDVQKSTLTAVRALPWAAAILGVQAPPIFVEREREVGYEHIPGVPPVTIVGKAVLSGRSQLEHAFLAGRHLAMYRAEHYIKTLFHAVQDLEDLFLAALTIGSPGLPIADDMKRRVQPIADAIAPMLESAQVDTLRGCFLRFVEEGGRTNLLRWATAVDKTACRAGLVLANDLNTACRVLHTEEGALGELGKDLICFVTSERYFRLRRQLGITVQP